MFPTAMEEYSLAAWAVSWFPLNRRCSGDAPTAAVVHVGPDRLLADRVGSGADQLLVGLAICWPIWATAWASAATRAVTTEYCCW